MTETLTTLDGTALDLDAGEQEFARAMAAPEPTDPQAPAPPRRELTEEERGAKYGYTTGEDGKPRAKKAPGRPRKQPARVTEAAPAEAPRGKTAPSVPDFTGPLAGLTDALWMVLAAAPAPSVPLRIKLRAQAKVLKDNQPGLVQGVNVCAQHNATIRRGVEALTTGGAGWVLPAVMAVAPFAMQSAALWRADPAQLGQLAAETEEEWAAQFAAMQASMLGPAPIGAEHQDQAADLAGAAAAGPV